MKATIVISLAAVLFGGGVLCASEEIDREMLPVLEKVKSKDAAEREAGVRELVGLREAVSDALKQIVADTNAGSLPEACKASALFLMGELGLLQCGDVLEQEKDWRWDPLAKIGTSREELLRALSGDSGDDIRRAMRGKPSVTIGAVGHNAEGRAGLGGSSRVVAPNVKADLGAYPFLSGALADLRSEVSKQRQAGQLGVWRWYQVIMRGTSSILGSPPEMVYPEDVRVTAAYVAGEFRTWADQRLCRNIDIKDEKGVCAGYPSALVVDGVDPAHPCAVALVKLGRRTSLDACLGQMGTKGISQEGRERIARVAMLIDPEATKAAYAKALARVSDPDAENLMRDAAGHRERLESLSEIIK